MIADFEAYMPDQHDGQPYGVKGVLDTARAAGIALSVVFPKGQPADPRPLNARLLEAVRSEESLMPGFLINPTMGPLALEDIERCAANGGRTIKLMAASYGYRIDAPCVDPVIDKAHQLGLPVTIHSGSDLAGCHPLSIGALCKRHPEVPMVMDHMGYREWVEDALDAAAEAPNLFLGTSLIAAVEPILIKNAVRSGRVGADRIIFGTNAPGGLAKHAVAGIREIGFNDDEMRMILWENFHRFYSL